MKAAISFILSLAGSLLWISAAFTFEDNRPWQPDWLAVSDKSELDRTWRQALIYLPKQAGEHFGRLLAKPKPFTEELNLNPSKPKLPTILYLHSCEGLGPHREDLKRFSGLGFVVIAPDSFAREHRPLGCDEERERFIRYFDIAVAFQKAELDYAVQRLQEFSWIDRNNLFLIGSGIGGMVAAHYQGADFAGHVIEGWGCRGPNPVFNGIWAPKDVRIFSTVSRNDPWFQKNPGFGVDCARFLKDRPGSVSVVLDRPAHYVSWYPKSRPALIEFLTRDWDIDTEALAADAPTIIERSAEAITLREKWSDEAVYAAAKGHCAKHGKRSHLIAEPQDKVYSFICD